MIFKILKRATLIFTLSCASTSLGLFASINVWAEIHESGAILCKDSGAQPCVRLAPLDGISNDLNQGRVVVYTSTSGRKYLERSTQHMQAHAGLWHDLGVWRRMSYNGSVENPSLHPVIGFGGAFTDSASLLISSLPVAIQDDLIRGYFSAIGPCPISSIAT
jgi:hypothetical protein